MPQLIHRFFSLTTKTKTQVSQGLFKGGIAWTQLRVQLAHLNQARGALAPCSSRAQDSVWASYLPLNICPSQLPASAYSCGQRSAAENRHKVLLDENSIFRRMLRRIHPVRYLQRAPDSFRSAGGTSGGDAVPGACSCQSERCLLSNGQCSARRIK